MKGKDMASRVLAIIVFIVSLLATIYVFGYFSKVSDLINKYEKDKAIMLEQNNLIESGNDVIESQKKIIDTQAKYIEELEKLLDNNNILID